jgi:hypothetical protein
LTCDSLVAKRIWRGKYANGRIWQKKDVRPRCNTSIISAGDKMEKYLLNYENTDIRIHFPTSEVLTLCKQSYNLSSSVAVEQGHYRFPKRVCPMGV